VQYGLETAGDQDYLRPIAELEQAPAKRAFWKALVAVPPSRLDQELAPRALPIDETSRSLLQLVVACPQVQVQAATLAGALAGRRAGFPDRRAFFRGAVGARRLVTSFLYNKDARDDGWDRAPTRRR